MKFRTESKCKNNIVRPKSAEFTSHGVRQVLINVDLAMDKFISEMEQKQRSTHDCRSIMFVTEESVAYLKCLRMTDLSVECMAIDVVPLYLALEDLSNRSYISMLVAIWPQN